MDSEEIRFCIGRATNDTTAPDAVLDADIQVRAHEAGHILVALINGFKVTKAVIGRTSSESVTFCCCTPEQSTAYWERAQTVCAGKAAEKLLFCFPSEEQLPGEEQDDERAKELIREFLQNTETASTQDPELLSHKVSNVLSACYEAVNGVLFCYYDALYVLTDQLRRGALTYDDLLSWSSAFPSLSSLPVFESGSSHSE